jgi:hypothetical protein
MAEVIGLLGGRYSEADKVLEVSLLLKHFSYQMLYQIFYRI